MRAGMFWIQRDSFLELFDCFIQITCLSISPTDKNMNLRLIAEAASHVSENLSRRRKLFLLEMGKSKCIANVKICGREFQSDTEMTRCLIKLAEHEMNFAEHMMRRRASWIFSKSLLKRINRLLILLNIETGRRQVYQSRFGNTTARRRAVERLDGFLILPFCQK